MTSISLLPELLVLAEADSFVVVDESEPLTANRTKRIAKSNVALVTPTANAIPKADAAGKLDVGWLPGAGIIEMYGGASAPAGYLLCNGASYVRADYAALFTAIGTTWGTADGTHFNVPDMRSRSPIGAGTGAGGGAGGTGLPAGGAALTAATLAGWKGAETHTLTAAEQASMPVKIINAGANMQGGGALTAYTFTNSSSNDGTYPMVATGGGGAHNNIQPVMGVNFIIKT